MSVLRFVLFLVLIYLIISTVGRFIFGLRKKASRCDYVDDNSSSTRREGDISIQVHQRSKKKINKDTGEYVNYEEIKDK